MSQSVVVAASFDVGHRVEVLAVAVEPETAAVKFVRAGLGHDVHDGALVAAILGREVVGDDLKLTDRVRVINKETGTGDRKVVVVLAVDVEVVGPAARAVY